MPLKSTLLNDLLNNPNRLDILAKAEEIKQPWLIVHGDEDTTVPLSHAHELEKANKHAEFKVIKGGDHTFGATQPYVGDALPAGLLEFCDLAINFLKD
jgi:pimeloyl-ACP methyl ester carboxylesterase